MANQSEVLKILSKAEGVTSPAAIAAELKSAQATIVTYLGRLRKKNYVEGGGQEWFITDAGKKALERGEEAIVTREDVGEDELSRFRIYGELAGVDTDLLEACVELFQNTEMRSMEEMERVLAELNIPLTNRNRWVALYRGYLRNTTPPEKRDQLYPVPEAVVVKEEVSTLAERKGEKLDFNVKGNDIVRVGEELGMFTFRQALQVVAAKGGTAPQPQNQGGMLKDFADAVASLNPNKPLTIQEVLEIVNTITEKRGSGGNDGPQPQKGFMVSADGEVTELKEGQPIVIKKVERQPAKTYYLNENQELVEQEAGKPILIKIQQQGAGSGMPAMLPFPVMGGDGKPVLDNEGKPVYANLEPMMKYLGFLGEQRRADERHDSLMSLAKTVRENVGDGVAALKTAASEIKGTKQQATSEESQVYECSDCHTQFRVPQGDFEKVTCPGCKTEYTKEALEST